jgi:hypothetical protein
MWKWLAKKAVVVSDTALIVISNVLMVDGAYHLAGPAAGELALGGVMFASIMLIPLRSRELNLLRLSMEQTPPPVPESLRL